MEDELARARQREQEGRCGRKKPFATPEAAAVSAQEVMDPNYHLCNGLAQMCAYRCPHCSLWHLSKVVHRFDGEDYRVIRRDPAFVRQVKPAEPAQLEALVQRVRDQYGRSR